MSTLANERLPRAFYTRHPCTVARDLLGKRLVRYRAGQRLTGIIVEVEAYAGQSDAASHASSGRTSRNWPMFALPGCAYVYFIYGMYWLFNIAAHEAEAAGAVLVRALEPECGQDIMCSLRGNKPKHLLTNGPARLAQALAIDKAFNGVDLCVHPKLTVEYAWDAPELDIVSGPRVRVPGDAQAKARPWRFWIRDHPYISK